MARRSGGSVLRSSPERTRPPEAMIAVAWKRYSSAGMLPLSVTASGSFHQSSPVLPVAQQVLARHLLEGVPLAADVAGTARAVDQAERRPDGMIAAQDEAVAGAAQDGLHAAAIGLDAGGLGSCSLPPCMAPQKLASSLK